MATSMRKLSRVCAAHVNVLEFCSYKLQHTDVCLQDT